MLYPNSIVVDGSVHPPFYSRPSTGASATQQLGTVQPDDQTSLIAIGQNVNVEEDNAVNILLNGNGGEGVDLEYVLVSQPQQGTLSGAAPNLSYQPSANFNGNDSFRFKVMAGQRESDVAR